MAEMLTPGYAFREYTENIKKGKSFVKSWKIA